MGVKNLTKLLQRYAPDSLKQKIIQDYQNKTVVIDGSIFLRKFVYGYRHVCIDNVSYEIPHPHIHGFYKLTLFLKKYNIKPIFIFDGRERIKEKRKELAKRKISSEKSLQNWNFEKNRKSRVNKWKGVVEKLDNLEETKSQFVTSGVKQVVEKILSSPSNSTEVTKLPSSMKIDGRKKIIASPPIIKTTHGIVQLSLQGMIAVVIHVEKALMLEHNKPKSIDKPIIKEKIVEIKTSIKDIKRKEDEKLKKIVKNEKNPEIKIAVPLINERMMKKIANLKDEKNFKDSHPDFEPSKDDIKLKEDMEQIIKKALQDTTQLATDKGFTKAQREVGVMEHLLIDSVLSRNKTSGHLAETFEAESHNLAVTYEKRVIPVTWDMYLESINFIRTWGIPCITLNGHEAEAMCASFVSHGLADATVSEDMDVTIFGDGVLLRQFFQKNKPILEISPAEAKKSLELSHDQYIDLCILCGTDFAGTIRNIGPITAFKLIKKHGSIENILQNLNSERYLVAPDYIDEINAARELFKNPPKVTTDIIQNHLENNVENVDEFNRLLDNFEIDPTINESLDYNVIAYGLNSDEYVNKKYLGPDPFSSNNTECTSQVCK
ncbi:20659_t:CDS:1 [Funneliformis geosporum]|uniref:8040_t:CDS:1 n=1 Tax=Funneliformis geosporum TaxID=1117311 RepID=A0A9W4SUN8_9GLOM|nr:8040_t:CDS:1 [Funneliformis geosporum]CAI2182211.1 20659_t:CDS:1 [Funneliformis geosporum]